MKNKNKIILSLFLSFIIVFFNFSLIYANDDETNEAVTTQTEQTVEVKEESKVEAGEKVKEAVNGTTSGTVNEKSYWWPWWPWPPNPPDPPSPPDPPTPTEPTEPTQPIEPTQPTEPTEPTEPTAPVEPTELTEPTEPTEPTESTEPINPTEPTEPVEPTQPIDPVTPTEPTEAIEPTEPTKIEPTKIKPAKTEPIKHEISKKSKPIVYIDNDYLISAANEELESNLSTHLPISTPEVVINTEPTESTSIIPQALALFNISLAFLTGILALISLAIRPTNNVASLIIGIIACITGLSSGQSLAAAKAASKILGGLLVGQVTISILKSKSFHFKK